MPWRQLASALRERVALPLRERIALHQARYRYTREEVGRVWITVDGREIAQFDTSSYVRRRAELAGDLRAANGLRPFGDGPIVHSLGVLEDYFVTHARPWERYAWLKARVVSGGHWISSCGLL